MAHFGSCYFICFSSKLLKYFTNPIMFVNKVFNRSQSKQNYNTLAQAST